MMKTPQEISTSSKQQLAAIKTKENGLMEADIPHCPNILGSLDHILTKCTHPTTHTIWNLIKQKWPDGKHNRHNIHHGHILGCGSVQPKAMDKDENMAKKCGTARNES